ncbi:putative PurR-regulated permease PerM [Ruminiclostridium sufflavum DSM 19573]|uniref:Putative PurR-regulated permease PerM n=1 Tax=Ruminiclostridium sufflavum DSM 19573 TaxID=1121337 RepID=A0A318XNL0_9FIRM|nr:AI-2E family transporter [Ruminiclostridium sufflavum]PYG89216.1 putative PurR-regulated permease PerM [Ruminiclostridium sufflavum DSM 19573]
MTTFKSIFSKQLSRRFLVLLAFSAVVYLLRGMANMFLLTFIFAYLGYTASNYFFSKAKIVNSRLLKAIIIAIYLGIIAIAVSILYKYIPVIVSELKSIIYQATFFLNRTYDNETLNYIISLIKDFKITTYISDNVDTLLKSISNIGKWGFDIFIAVILSLMFILEKTKIVKFTSAFQNSKVNFIYEELSFFGHKFLQSFGKVIQTQITISFINCILSMIMLSILKFPQILGLGFMIFVLGMIPVAGVIISLIPLTIIAFNIGGFKMIIYVLVLVAILHALESYILNPKLMSQKTKLPVFYTFIVLIVSENILGIWGLIIGIPIFIFILDVLEVKHFDIVPPESEAIK